MGSRVLSIQPTNQLFLLLKRVSHGDRSDNLRRCFVPPVLQAHQLPALIETVTGHDEMEVSLLRSFPSAYSSLCLTSVTLRTFRPTPLPTTRWWRSDLSRLPCGSRRSPRPVYLPWIALASVYLQQGRLSSRVSHRSPPYSLLWNVLRSSILKAALYTIV